RAGEVANGLAADGGVDLPDQIAEGAGIDDEEGPVAADGGGGDIVKVKAQRIGGGADRVFEGVSDKQARGERAAGLGSGVVSEDAREDADGGMEEGGGAISADDREAGVGGGHQESLGVFL